MEWLASPDAWISLLTLTAMEIVLGIDNLVFLSILADRLPEHQRARARRLGLIAALGMRVGLLFAITWVIGLSAELFAVFDHAISWRDIILIVGGAFLIAKATTEIHEKVEGPDRPGGASAPGKLAAGFAAIVAQIAIMDLVFSIDSVLTAIGMADHVEIMVVAIVIAIAVMLVSAEWVADFINRHPTIKMLALSFLLLIGMALVADGLEFHIPKGYIYAAMGFAVFVEALNFAARRSRRESKAG